ncbi:hypothetical protein G6F24_015451 [Rhizopus arrhizus]|nr:hypothetical protein G6F24_015451 [Rhizopus arrhizus]
MGLPAHVGVHRTQLAEVVGRVGQYPGTGGDTRGLGLLLGVRGLAAAGLRWCTDEAGQIVEVQSPGFERGRQPRACTADVELQVATEIAVADLAGELLVAPGLVGALEAAIQCVWRRGRNGDAEQRVQVGQVLATECELQVEHAQLERIGKRAAGHRVGCPGAAIEVDAERVVAVGQLQR